MFSKQDKSRFSRTRVKPVSDILVLRMYVNRGYSDKPAHMHSLDRAKLLVKRYGSYPSHCVCSLSSPGNTLVERYEKSFPPIPSDYFRQVYFLFSGDLAWSIIKGPIEAIVGVLYGIIVGAVIWYFPSRFSVSTYFNSLTLCKLIDSSFWVDTINLG